LVPVPLSTHSVSPEVDSEMMGSSTLSNPSTLKSMTKFRSIGRSFDGSILIEKIFCASYPCLSWSFSIRDLQAVENFATDLTDANLELLCKR